MQVEFVKELEDKVIYLQSSGKKYTVIECERFKDGDVNPIPVRMMTCLNLKNALKVMEAWGNRA